jgi:hypothetical protein
MRNRWMVGLAMAVVMVMGIVASGLAADTATFALMGQKDTPTASGTATLAGKTLTVTATGLKPKAVYTVWLVNMSPTMSKAGAGTAPYAFTADAKGGATYTAELSESPVGKWQSIMIVRHTTGDPKNMNDMAEGLMAKLM